MADITLRPYQAKAEDNFYEAIDRGFRRLLAVLSTGTGKCLGKDTEVLMYDGTVKKVQDIEVGDKLMGPDSKPRTVLSTDTGQEELYKVKPTKGEPWICNKSHILTLVCNRKGSYNNGNFYPNDEYNKSKDISVEDYLEQSSSFKHTHKLYKTGVEFDKKELEINPYLLGVWLGDGTQCKLQITNPDEEIHNWLENYFDNKELNLNKYEPKGKCAHFSITDPKANWNTKNRLYQTFSNLNLLNNRHIPHHFLTSNREDRLELLAGLLDTDGHLSKGGTTFSIIQKKEEFAEQIMFLARSLGFASYKSEKTGRIKSRNFEGTYYRVRIIGDTSEIPCRVKRKQAKKREQIKNPLRNGFELESLGVGKYYGFTLKEEPHFLLGDFTVTHNTFLACKLIKDYAKKGHSSLVLVDRKVLAQQWKDSLLEIDPTLSVGIEMNTNKASRKHDVVIASLQTLGRKGVKRIKKFKPEDFSLVIADEAHKFPTAQGFRVLEYFEVGKENFNEDKVLLGLTATAARNDNVSLGSLFDEIIAEYTIDKAIDDGWLVDFEWVPIDLDRDLSKANSSGEFNLKKLSDILNIPDLNYKIVKAYKEYFNEGDTFLCYCVDVDHAYALSELFNEYGIDSAVVEANTNDDEKRQIIQDHKNGDLQGLFNYGVLTEGYDDTEVKGILMPRLTKSNPLFTQIFGRMLRPSKSAFVDAFDDKEKRKKSIAQSQKPKAIFVDFCNYSVDNIVTVPKMFGLNPQLNEKKERFYKEVVEPIEQAHKEKQIDKQKVKNLDDIDLLVKNKKHDIKSLKFDESISDYTNRRWIDVGEGSYEIIYGEDNKILIIEKDQISSDLIEKTQYDLLEYDTKQETTKKLQTFNSIASAFKIADEYATEQGYETKYRELAPWMQQPPTEKQYNFLLQLYTYKTGYCEFEKLNERYENGLRKLKYKKTDEVIENSAMVSDLIGQKLNN